MTIQLGNHFKGVTGKREEIVMYVTTYCDKCKRAGTTDSYKIEITKSPYGYNVTTVGLIRNRIFDADSHKEATRIAKQWSKELGLWVHDVQERTGT